MQTEERIASVYSRFAESEADGSAPLYAELARGVAADPDALVFLAGLPQEKRQPNLLLPALRHVAGTARDWPHARAMLHAEADAIRAVMLSRRTQTNEPGRCAVLLPVLARLPQPLALPEVGASAGLCLLPDHYGYEYGDRRIAPASPDVSVFACRASTGTPLPDALPQIGWRAGIDLAPIDPHEEAECAWLETLVWPEHTRRLLGLRAALRIAREAAPPVHHGDLLSCLEPLARTAPPECTLVGFHTAVLAYVAPAGRARFARTVQALGATWISNERPQVFPKIAACVPPGPPGAFLLAVNGQAVAWTHPHGLWIDWLEPEGVSK